MYNQDYEEYIRSILGYNNEVYREVPYSTYNANTTASSYPTSYNDTYRRNDELEQYYPEIYKIVYPMVKKVCSNSRGDINRETLENMVDEVYSAIEVGENRNETKDISQNNRSTQTKTENITNTKTKENKNEKETRESRNPGIRDLIKILILRELLRDNHRPPMPPPRPPFPGNGRPPIRPRIYEDYI